MKLNNVIALACVCILVIMLASCGNGVTNTTTKDSISKTDSVVKTTSFTLPIPEGWTTEVIAFPIEFAPQINYTGVENLRFAKGWEDITSDEHWCYAFLWWLNGKPAINENVLQHNLEDYYSGLVQKNITKRSIPALKVVPTIVKINVDETAANDLSTYKGTISMLDYIAQTPMILNCIIHVKKCAAQDITAIFFEISPRSFDHVLWKQLNYLNDSISCNN